MKKINSKELAEKYKDKPTDTAEYIINGKKYIVVSHYCGNKDINEVLYNLAFKQAYKDMQNIHYQNIDFGGGV